MKKNIGIDIKILLQLRNPNSDKKRLEVFSAIVEETKKRSGTKMSGKSQISEESEQTQTHSLDSTQEEIILFDEDEKTKIKDKANLE